MNENEYIAIVEEINAGIKLITSISIDTADRLNKLVGTVTNLVGTITNLDLRISKIENPDGIPENEQLDEYIPKGDE